MIVHISLSLVKEGGGVIVLGQGVQYTGSRKISTAKKNLIFSLQFKKVSLMFLNLAIFLNGASNIMQMPQKFLLVEVRKLKIPLNIK